MSECEHSFDPNILIGLRNLISRFSDFALIGLVLGHCDLILRFSDFALYLDTQLVYFNIR